jgi:hypothetical protein
MSEVILFPQYGSVAVMVPTGMFSTIDTAVKDVPAGVPFLIVSDTDLPQGIPQEAWVVDFSTPDGVGGQNG